MVRFDTLSSHETSFGTNNFIEVARKVARDETKPDDKGVEFVSISRGYTDGSGHRRFRMHFTMPPEPELLEFLSQAIGRLR